MLQPSPRGAEPARPSADAPESDARAGKLVDLLGPRIQHG
jgi:hypothetical protein